MASGSGKRLDRTAKIGIGLIVALILTLPAIALIVSFQDGEDRNVRYEPETGSPTGDMSMDAESRSAWEDYLGSAPSLELEFPDISGKVRKEEPDLTYSIPDLNGSDAEFREGSDGKESGQNAADDGSYSDDREESPALDSDAGSGEEREVEESDIVKVIGNRMYVLNMYRGLVVVNLEDTTSPFVEGSVRTLGYPVSMYVVDFLGFVIVSNAPSLDGSGEYSGMLYIIDLMDNSNPRVVKMVELPGFPVDSRRVGEVIYVVSNEYASYYHEPWFRGGILEGDAGIAIEDGSIRSEEEGPTTFITSIGFYDPASIGQRDRVEIRGNAGMIHASSFAIYVPQPNHDYRDPETRFVYTDISDPEGDIVIRDDITIPGLLMDRYQMDHYRGMFRVVTQEWPSADWWSDLPMSTLYVIDARDPDDLERVSSLLVDDSGNLMATRFAGDRAYTIHLPRTIDPLDVIDLSDPTKPELTDILELPGWVEHMEVIGYNIIAVGVDDSSEDGWKVALSLFDVTDPEEAILEDRIVIGEGHTYSSANYDPKALTILEDQGMVLIPFNSYDWTRYEGQQNGVQMISFDLVEGTLEEWGTIASDDTVERTRFVNDAVITMSQRTVMTVDAGQKDSPRILGRVELASNIVDAFYSGDHLVTMVEPYWGQTGGSIRISHKDNPYSIIDEYETSGLEFTNTFRSDNIVYIKGVRQGGGKPPVSELRIYDMSDPLNPIITGPVTIEIPGSGYNYYPKYSYDEESGENISADEKEYSRIYYDPMTMDVLSDGSVAIYRSGGRYPYYGSASYVELYLVSWNSGGDISIRNMTVDSGSDYIRDIAGNDDRIILVSQNWWPPSTMIRGIDLTGEEINISGVHELTGNYIGSSGDLSRIYTRAEYYDNETVHYNINVYSMDDGGMELLQSVNVGSPLSDVRFTGDSIVVISQKWDIWWGYGYPEDDVVYSDVESGERRVDDVSEPYTPEEGTEIILIELVDGLFGNISRLELATYAYASLVTDEFLVLDRSMTHTVISLEDDLESMGTWFGNGWVRGGDLSGNDLVLALGMYGLEFRQL